ncbi:hypothetical protein PIB30_064743 [Stylosanthes scabra]|uniref:DUF3741 domain-containing protein n=1 Tax=Stylosanthes scabra TaxID=79078 RepID=A0ABU6SN85_9FABA|nr:hypothetical protein [Stylosanthes scabra]
MASDKDEELKSNEHKNSNNNNEAAFCEAGVVAKLMGLEIPIEVKKEGSSVSSMEKPMHKSCSSSFHGVPTTFHLHENEDFIVLSFESNSKGRKNKNNNGCLGKNKVANECSSSEDSSPVSVFDFQRQLLQTDADSFGVDLNWRRNLSPQLENEQQHAPHSDSDILLLLEEEKLKANENNKHDMLKKTENQRHNDYDHIWSQICKLVEQDLFGLDQIKAARMRKCEIENICADFESQIFCYLLNELIDQLVISF